MKLTKAKKSICAVFSLACLICSASAYSTSSAISYSDKYALSINGKPITGGYNDYGGSDCTNYVSQCVFAGGLAQDSIWYSKLQTSGSGAGTWRNDSTAWTLADGFKNYLKNNNKATKIGGWSQSGQYGTNKYQDNSANLTSSNAGKTVLFYDWGGEGTMNHAAFFVKNNAKSEDSQDGGATGDLINQHSGFRKHAIWHGDKRNEDRKTTEIYAF